MSEKALGVEAFLGFERGAEGQPLGLGAGGVVTALPESGKGTIGVSTMQRNHHCFVEIVARAQLLKK